jgi:hypothetical protein
MGTSGPSRGPGGGVPLVPPWVAPLPPAAQENPEVLSPDNPPAVPQLPDVPPPLLPAGVLAPPRRFAGARTSLGNFALTGSRSDLENGLGHYARTGLGGGVQGARRMAGTSRTAGNLYDVLDALRTGNAPPVDLGVELAALAGRPAREIMDVIIEAIRPTDGSQDAEASRQAISSATSDLLTDFPDADLATLTSDQIDLLIEHYVGHDLCLRIELDVGGSIEGRAPDAATAVRRLEEMKDYVIEKVRATFASLRAVGTRFQRGRVATLVATILTTTLDIFEEYLR